jgi:hypothetical protein
MLYGQIYDESSTKIKWKIGSPMFSYGHRKCMSEVKLIERIHWYPKHVDC